MAISLFACSYLTYKPWLISQRTIFFSHTKSANRSTFNHGLSAKQDQTNRTTVDIGIASILLLRDLTALTISCAKRQWSASVQTVALYCLFQQPKWHGFRMQNRMRDSPYNLSHLQIWASLYIYVKPNWHLLQRRGNSETSKLVR